MSALPAPFALTPDTLAAAAASEVEARFHPAVEHWFARTHGKPSEPQRRGWPHIQAGEHTLIAAPTGSGKTLAAFLAALDDLVQRGLAGALGDELSILYISPLKALSNDVEKNLQQPLRGIRESLLELGYPPVEIRSVVRTGDTPASERAKLHRSPPHILVTTPESLYILLTSESGRAALSSVRTVIIDEIHALVADKRGAHLALSLERLAALAPGRVTRIGLSATQRPIDVVARFLVGTASEPCAIVDCGHRRRMLLDIELPASPLEAVMSGEVWTEVYDRIAALVRENRTTLVFVSNRRLAERLCRHLEERLGEGRVMAHHGSLAKEIRLDAEQRLKAGALAALVATASLELGIDIGSVDLVCQVGSPRSIARLLQRVGRAGHQLDGVPMGKVFPLSRNDLVECAAVLDSVRRGELDRVVVREAPLDILAQQIVAMAAAEDVSEDALFERVRRSYPYHALDRERFDAVLEMLAQGFRTSRGRRAALIRHDRVTQLVQGRKAARLTALTNGGAIADNTDYRVVLEPEMTHVGSIGEDFAIESMAGDIFQLGNASWRILKVENGLVRVADARGEPPTIPFWLGEAPARSDELSGSVSRLKTELSERLERAGFEDEAQADAAIRAARDWMLNELGLSEAATDQLIDYLAAAKRTLGALPTRDTVVVERFFDEAENTHLVIHSSFGARINRAWGLALRKRFCKTFNFELQAAASEDAIILSLGPSHSFELSSVGKFLNSNTAEGVLVQALLDSPMFEIRWRHNATRSLATPRFQSGKKVPANLVRIRANDLLTSAFPDQQACLENIVGEREVPDHPLVQQTIRDCLTEAMDVDGFLELLRSIESGGVRVLYRDLTEASPLSHEIINANPYAFLDPAPLEERRTQAIMTRRFFDPVKSSDLGRLDADAIARVKAEAWPAFASADELADALAVAGFLLESEGLHGGSGVSAGAALSLFERLVEQGRATRAALGAGSVAWVSAERLAAFVSFCPGASLAPALMLPAALAGEVSPEDAVRELVRGRLGSLGPVSARALAEPFRALLGDEALRRVNTALLDLETEGAAMRGRFSPWASEEEWCERGLLARIHRYTLERLRREIEPVSTAAFMRFEFAWQRVSREQRASGRESLPEVLALLEGFEAAAGAWESGLLAARLSDYDPSWLDGACLSGQLGWGRVSSPASGKAVRSLGTTPIVLAPRESWSWLARGGSAVADAELSEPAQRLLEHLRQSGACFLHDLGRTLPDREELARAISELVAAGRVSSDSFGGMRGLLPAEKRRLGARGARAAAGLESAGRWSLLPEPTPLEPGDVERWARLLARRYGVVFRALVARENAPPWRDLLREYRRLEARGEIRGGRFVERHAGEQFALPEAVPLLRRQRHAPAELEETCLSACDPLNLLGTLLPGERLAALPTHRILFRDALPLAVLEAGEVRFLVELDES
ncbi:MAG TPA: DEAD/DEAH box helicase, partial [Polyangiaceae bacterium]|nr:DEAD/DEAH box helicase [Polyangiaceae bacterium]